MQLLKYAPVNYTVRLGGPVTSAHRPPGSVWRRSRPLLLALPNESIQVPTMVDNAHVSSLTGCLTAASFSSPISIMAGVSQERDQGRIVLRLGQYGKCPKVSRCWWYRCKVATDVLRQVGRISFGARASTDLFVLIGSSGYQQRSAWDSV